MRLLFTGMSLMLLLSLRVSTLPAAEDSLAIPGGVADEAGNVGYLTSPGGGIVAVNLEDGDALWESKEATRPLAVAGNRLAAFVPEKGNANVFRIALLDGQDKGRKDKVKVSEPITLPDWAKVGTGLEHNYGGARFSAAAHLEDGDLLVKWNAGTYYYGGAAPPPEVLKASTKSASGIAKVDLETGKVETLKDDDKPAPTGSGLTSGDKLPQAVRAAAQREGWSAGCVIGERVYGQVQKSAEPMRFDSVIVSSIQALDIKSGKLLWERAFQEKRILPPPP